MTSENQDNINKLSDTVKTAASQLPVQIDIVRSLQAEIFGFVGEHIKRIESVYRLRDKFEAKVEQSLDQNAYSPQEAMAFYRSLTQQAESGTDMIVSLFKPAPGVESFLARNLSEDHTQKDKEQAAVDVLKSTSPDMLQKLDALARWVSDPSSAAIPASPLLVEDHLQAAINIDVPTPWSDDEEEVPDA
jgi:hypothetical protein